MLARSPPPRKRRPLQPLFFDVDAQRELSGFLDPGADVSIPEHRASDQKRQRLDHGKSGRELAEQLGTDAHLSGSHEPSISTARGALVRIVQGEGENATPQNEGLCCTYECTNLVKREFFEQLEDQRRTLNTLKQELATERGARDEAQAESVSLARKLRECRGVIAGAEAREEEIQRLRQEEARKAEERWREEVARVIELQRRLDKESAARMEAEASARSAEARAVAAETEGNQNANQANREIRGLKLHLERAEGDHRSAVAKAEMQMKALKLRADTAVAEADAAVEALDEARSSLRRLQEENTSLEKALAEAQSQAVVAGLRTDRNREMEVLVEQMRDELARGAADIAEARRLKDTASRVAVLRERLASAEGRAERAEAMMREFAEAKERIKALEDELRLWEETARRMPGVQGRGDLGTKFEELQKEAMVAKVKEGDFGEEAARLKSALASVDALLREAQSDKVAAEGRADEMALALRRAERKVALLIKERDGLKAILASYEEEEALERSEQGKDASEDARAAKAKIQQLETELAAAREREKELEGNLAEATEGAARQRQRADGLQKELDESWRKTKGLEREIEQLSREVAMLESKVGKGDYNRATTKVLHLAMNPEVEAQRKLAKDSLQAEVEELRAKVQQLEEGARKSPGGPGEDQPGEDAREASQQVAVLTSRVNALEKKEARYKQVFADKISVFRQACTHLFGYVIEMSDSQDAASGAPITTFSICSIYADDDEDRLLFQYRDGAMEMLANDFSRSPDLVRQVSIFLGKYKSIPALTANLTVESFNKHTIT